jgi:iron complex transport system ATP-binding protein
MEEVQHSHVTENEVPALQARDLSVGYMQGTKAQPVASQINFSLGKGVMAAIVGVNGIGKSTLLRTLGKVQPPLSGSIMYDGQDLHRLKSKALAARVSLVLTDPIATRSLKVAELVCLGRQPYTNWIGHLSPNDREIVKSALETVEITPLQHKKCYELSDGQMQKVLIARALAQDTGILLLDEPTTHLDLYHKVQILTLLQQIAHKRNKTILFTTHEVDMAIQLCDQMLLLDNKANPFGQPCTLIAEKRFDSLFPPDLIRFDASSGTFRVGKSAPDINK